MKMFTLLQSAEAVEVAATEANDAVQAIAEQPAEPASAEAPVKPAGGGLSMWVMLALMFAVMWFFMIRPQKKQQKELQNFRDSLKNGDKVVTIGGLYGTVAEIKDASVLIEVDKNVKIRVSKQALVKDFSDPQQ